MRRFEPNDQMPEINPIWFIILCVFLFIIVIGSLVLLLS